MSDALHKKTIRQIVSRQVVTVSADTTVAEAVEVMARHAISCLVVAEEKRPVGIFTERDLVKVADRYASFSSFPIDSLMSSPVVTIDGHLSVFEAYSLMVANRIRHHVVVDKRGKILGVMSQSDIISFLGLEYFMELRKIDQVMTRNVAQVGRETPLADAIAFMARSEISCVVVEQDGRPSGIITERDATRLVAEGVHLERVSAGSVMSSPVKVVQAGDTVHRAASLMKQEGIRRVVVVDREGRTAGIITQTDVIKGLEGQYIESLKEIIREKEDMFQQTAKDLLDKTVYLDNILRSLTDTAIIATDAELHIKYFNPVAEMLLGCAATSVIGHSALELKALEGGTLQLLEAAREQARKRGKSSFVGEIARGGQVHYFETSLSSILDRQATLMGYVIMMRDVTEQRQQEETIRHLAFHDALTGLPNRVLLNDRLEQALAAARRGGTRGALMILDLDRFKDINDTLGHGMGDQLLQAVAERLAGLLRKSDTVSRMGGDEFVLLLPLVSSAEGVAVVAGKIVAALQQPFLCEGHSLSVTASVGIAEFPADGDDSETLLKKADIALYRVKEGGRNGFQRFTAHKKGADASNP
jgi:diguanylate cyclase (GGDEF)-like protein/PAS domain S-box-containing protein